MKYVLEIRLKSGLWVRATHLRPIKAYETDGKVQVERTPKGVRTKKPKYLRVEWPDEVNREKDRVWVFAMDDVEAWALWEEPR